jgi:hypothetical protein
MILVNYRKLQHFHVGVHNYAVELHVAPSVNIGGLVLHNFGLGEDTLKCKHDKCKADQTGEKSHDKNLHVNLLDPVFSTQLAISVWLAVENARLENMLHQQLSSGTEDLLLLGKTRACC